MRCHGTKCPLLTAFFKRHRSIDLAASKNGVLLSPSVTVSRTITGLGLKNRFYNTDRDGTVCEGSVQLYSGHRSVHMY